MRYYIVDAFANKVFEGNPAGVCPLEDWLPDTVMQQIAFENNLSETAFVVPKGDAFGLRWFTPTTEVDLCGHATLASAFVVHKFVRPDMRDLRFTTRSGELAVACLDNGLYELDFPALSWQAGKLPQGLAEALGSVVPLEVYASRDVVLVLEDEAAVRAVKPDFAWLLKVETGHGFLVTAAGSEYDFVSRAFFPKMGINEDPVCGSAHCMLTPFWAHRLGKNELKARQVSQRGGTLYCKTAGERVKIAGRAALYLQGEFLCKWA